MHGEDSAQPKANILKMDRQGHCGRSMMRSAARSEGRATGWVSLKQSWRQDLWWFLEGNLRDSSGGGTGKELV